MDVRNSRIYRVSRSEGDLAQGPGKMIGKNIHKLRKQHGITLSELAERTGVSKSYLSSIERDLKQNPSIHLMERIASVLKVELKQLLKMDLDPERVQQLEKEWLDFIYELKKSGIKKEQINDYRILIEFIKWYNEAKEYKK